MLPIKYLTLEGRDLKDDSKKFLDGVLLALVNILEEHGIDTNDVDFLATNDIYIFRGTTIAIISLSRSKRLIQPQFSEISLSDVTRTDNSISVDEIVASWDIKRAQYFTLDGWSDMLSTRFHCKSTVSICFPSSDFSLPDDEMVIKQRQVAELLVEPAKEDVDRKKRIVRVRPIFEGRDFLVDSNLCFVLMEFKSPYTEIYRDLIKITVENEGFQCVKSDDIFSTEPVIDDIWANINKSALIIAEISSNNPNVMYELGICHTVGKNVMMVTQHPDQIPFNFRHMRVYAYTNDIPGSEELRKNLQGVIRHIKATQNY